MTREILTQAYSAMRHDLRKTILTMLGMAWGIATVVLLLAYGEGFGRAIQGIFESYGATGVGIYGGRTSQQAGGNKAGVEIRFTDEDVELLRNVVPLVRHISRVIHKDCTVAERSTVVYLPGNGRRPFHTEHLGAGYAVGALFQRSGQSQPRPHCGVRFGSQEKLFSGVAPLGREHSH